MYRRRLVININIVYLFAAGITGYTRFGSKRIEVMDVAKMPI